MWVTAGEWMALSTFRWRRLVAELIEQPHTLAEKCGDEVDLHLVEKSSVEALLHDVRGTGHRDVFVAGRLAALGER
jgi:hypothetical protein